MTIEDALSRLTAGLAEDETIARAAVKTGGTNWDWDIDQAGAPSESIRYGVFDQARHKRVACIYKDEYGSGALSRHIARHDPDRTLRQVEAFRKVLARYEEAERDSVLSDRDAGFEAGMYAALEMLAGIYAEDTEPEGTP